MFKWPLGRGKEKDDKAKPKAEAVKDAKEEKSKGSTSMPDEDGKKPEGKSLQKYLDELKEKLEVSEIINQKLKKDNHTLLDAYNELRRIWHQSIKNEVANVSSQHVDEATELRTLTEVMEQELAEISEENSQLYIGVWNLLQQSRSRPGRKKKQIKKLEHVLAGGAINSPPGIMIPQPTTATLHTTTGAATPSPGMFPVRSKYFLEQEAEGTTTSAMEGTPTSDEPAVESSSPLPASQVADLPFQVRPSRAYSTFTESPGGRPPSAPLMSTAIGANIGSLTTVTAVGQRIGRLNTGPQKLPSSFTTAEDVQPSHEVSSLISPPHLMRWQSLGSPGGHRRQPTTSQFGSHALRIPPVESPSDSVKLNVSDTEGDTPDSPAHLAVKSPTHESPSHAARAHSQLIHGGGIWTDIHRPPPVAAPIPMLLALKSLLRKRGTMGVLHINGHDPIVTHGSVPLPTGDIARKKAIVDAFMKTLQDRAGIAKARAPGAYALAASRLALPELLDRRRLTLAMFGNEVLENPKEAVVIQPGSRKGATLCALPMLSTFDSVANDLNIHDSLASLPWQPPLYKQQLESSIAKWRFDQLPQAWKDLIREPVIILNGQPYPVGTLERLLRFVKDLRKLVTPVAAAVCSSALGIPKRFCYRNFTAVPPSTAAMERKIDTAMNRADHILSSAPADVRQRYESGECLGDTVENPTPIQALHGLVADCIMCDIMVCASRTTAGGDAYIQVSQLLSVPGAVSVMGEHARLSSPIEIMVVPPDSIFIMTVARFRSCTTPGLTIWPVAPPTTEAEEASSMGTEADPDHGPVPWLSIKSTVAEAIHYSLDMAWDETPRPTPERKVPESPQQPNATVGLGPLEAPTCFFLPLKREGLRRLQMSLHGLHSLRDAVHAEVDKKQKTTTAASRPPQALQAKPPLTGKQEPSTVEDSLHQVSSQSPTSVH